MRAITAGLAVLLLAGCGGSSNGETSGDTERLEQKLDVCVQALDEANRGFRILAGDVETVQIALRQAFAGNVNLARGTLSGVEHADASRYKDLEAECRAAAAD